MFKGISNGTELIFSSFRIFKKYPILIAPIFIVWLVYAPLAVYFKWHFPWENYNTTGQLTFVFLFIYIMALFLSLACSILLELLEQKETGKELNLYKSIKDTFSKNISHIVAIAIIWSFVWFILVVLEALLRNDDKDNDDEESAENIAKTLAGADSFSWTSFSFDVIKKGIRMCVFLIIPGVAWENLGIRDSFKRGFSVLKDRRVEFITGFSLSLGIEFIIFLPPAIMFYLSAKVGMEFPESAWYICILYVGLAWSYSIYLEQMFAAELYLWQMQYEKEVKIASEKGLAKPKFDEIRRPSIIDEVPDLIN